MGESSCEKRPPFLAVVLYLGRTLIFKCVGLSLLLFSPARLRCLYASCRFFFVSSDEFSDYCFAMLLRFCTGLSMPSFWNGCATWNCREKLVWLLISDAASSREKPPPAARKPRPLAYLRRASTEA